MVLPGVSEEEEEERRWMEDLTMRPVDADAIYNEALENHQKGFWRKETDFCSYGEYQTNTGGSNNVAD